MRRKAHGTDPRGGQSRLGGPPRTGVRAEAPGGKKNAEIVAPSADGIVRAVAGSRETLEGKGAERPKPNIKIRSPTSHKGAKRRGGGQRGAPGEMLPQDPAGGGGGQEIESPAKRRTPLIPTAGPSWRQGPSPAFH